MSKRTGMSAESLSVLKYAAAQTGGDLSNVEVAIRRMQKTIAGVADEHADRGGAGITVVTFGSE
jgi:hypothetical protein